MADIYIRSWVKTDQRYWMSRKKTKRAERTKPTPMLKTTRQQMGYSRQINFHVKTILSSMQNTKNTPKVRPKLISVCTFLENKKRYFGTLTFVKIPALLINEVMPWLVDSLK